MTARAMNAKDFAKAVRLVVPKNVLPRGRKVFLIVAANVHRELTLGTKVDTGYLRASLAASTTGVPFPTPPVKPTGKGHTPKPRQFAPLWPRAQMQAAGAIARAVKGLTTLSFAYGASYARYEKTGAPQNVRRVRARIPGFVRDAVRAAEHLSSSEAAD